MNSVNIMGRIVNEPELKFTKNQKPVTSIRVAVDSGYAAQDGSRQAYFFDVVAWDGTAQFITTWFTKGQMVAISGKLTTRSWTDKFEQKRVSVEIVAHNVFFCGERRQSEFPPQSAQLTAPPSQCDRGAINPPPPDGGAPFRQGGHDAAPAGEQMRFSYSNDFRPLGDDDDVPF